MTPATQAATVMASSQCDECKEVTTSIDTPSESFLSAMQRYERRCLFCGVVIITGPNGQHEMKTATNVALKVTLKKMCAGRRKALSLTKRQQLPCSHLTKRQQLPGSHLTKRQQLPCSHLTKRQQLPGSHFNKETTPALFPFNKGTTAALFPSSFCSVLAACPRSLSQASISILVKGQNLSAPIDSGSSDSFIDGRIIETGALCSSLNAEYFFGSQYGKVLYTLPLFSDINLNDLSYTAMHHLGGGAGGCRLGTFFPPPSPPPPPPPLLGNFIIKIHY